METSEDYFIGNDLLQPDLIEKLDCLMEIHFQTKLSNK